MMRKGIAEFDKEIDYCSLGNDTASHKNNRPGDKTGCFQTETSYGKESPSKPIFHKSQERNKDFESKGISSQLSQTAIMAPCDSKERIWNRLHKPKHDTEMLFGEFKNLKEQHELSECTFVPKITKDCNSKFKKTDQLDN